MSIFPIANCHNKIISLIVQCILSFTIFLPLAELIWGLNGITCESCIAQHLQYNFPSVGFEGSPTFSRLRLSIDPFTGQRKTNHKAYSQLLRTPMPITSAPMKKKRAKCQPCLYTYIYTHIHIYVCICVYIYIYPSIHIWMDIYTHIHIHIYIHAYNFQIYTFICIYNDTHQ